MNTWNAGYVTDIGYTYGYYAELNPLRAQFALTSAGLIAPQVTAACELGFGQGVSVNIHAATSQTAWYGNDFNPSQAAFAQDLAQAAQSGAKLTDEAFADFCTRDDLPDFDYIGLHGIWSWISDANRQHIVDFIRRKLKVGGVVYVSYNTLPGWGPMVPLRDLLQMHTKASSGPNVPLPNRIGDALEFAEKLIGLNAIYTRACPMVAERFKQIKTQDRSYLAHEYFNKDWEPMNFGDMQEWMDQAKLTYTCSVHLLDHVTGINFTKEQRDLLAGIAHVPLREMTRDFLHNQQFRRDIWVKGPRQQQPHLRIEQLRAQRVVLVTPVADVKFQVSGSVGLVDMNEQVYRPIINALGDHKPRTLGELEAMGRDQSLPLNAIVEAVQILIGKGDVMLAQPESAARAAKGRTDKLNETLLRRAIDGTPVPFLASAQLGGGVAVGRVQQLFILSYAQGKRQPEDLVHFAWTILSSQGQRLVVEGKALSTPEENVAELTRQASLFLTTQLPLFKSLGVF